MNPDDTHIADTLLDGTLREIHRRMPPQSWRNAKFARFRDWRDRSRNPARPTLQVQSTTPQHRNLLKSSDKRNFSDELQSHLRPSVNAVFSRVPETGGGRKQFLAMETSRKIKKQFIDCVFKRIIDPAS